MFMRGELDREHKSPDHTQSVMCPSLPRSTHVVAMVLKAQMLFAVLSPDRWDTSVKRADISVGTDYAKY